MIDRQAEAQLFRQAVNATRAVTTVEEKSYLEKLNEYFSGKAGLPTPSKSDLPLKRCYAIQRDGYGPYCIVSIGHPLSDEFDGSDPGEEIKVTYLEMAVEDFENLPEFQGW